MQISTEEVVSNYRFEDRDDVYIVHYSRDFISLGVLQPTTQSNRESFFKIRKSDLEARNLTISSPELQLFIKSRLKKLIGFDFDQTLSNKFVFYVGSDTSESNLKGGFFTKVMLAKYSNRSDLISFVVSRNNKGSIEEHLQAWKISQFFCSIKGRGSFLDDKQTAFLQMYNEIMKSSALDKDRFLNFDAPGPIDIVQMILVDDDAQIKRFENFGIKTIQVNIKRDDIDHFKQLDSILNSNNLLSVNNSQLFKPEFLKKQNLVKAALDVMELVVNCNQTSDAGFKCADGEVIEYVDFTDWFIIDKFKKMTNTYDPSDIAQTILNIIGSFSRNEALVKKYLNSPGHVGQTLLHFFLPTLNLEAVSLLIKAGADINAEDNWEDTPFKVLLRAADSLSPQYVSSLIALGANLDEEDKEALKEKEFSEIATNKLNNQQQEFDSIENPTKKAKVSSLEVTFSSPIYSSSQPDLKKDDEFISGLNYH